MRRGTQRPSVLPTPREPAEAINLYRRRAVIHVPDSDPKERQRWLAACLAACERLGLEVASVATDWTGVDQAFAAGEADVLMVARHDHIKQDRVIVACEVGERRDGYTSPRQRRPQPLT